jgi:hypothetical protein
MDVAPAIRSRESTVRPITYKCGSGVCSESEETAGGSSLALCGFDERHTTDQLLGIDGSATTPSLGDSRFGGRHTNDQLSGSDGRGYDLQTVDPVVSAQETGCDLTDVALAISSQKLTVGSPLTLCGFDRRCTSGQLSGIGGRGRCRYGVRGDPRQVAVNRGKTRYERDKASQKEDVSFVLAMIYLSCIQRSGSIASITSFPFKSLSLLHPFHSFLNPMDSPLLNSEPDPQYIRSGADVRGLAQGRVEQDTREDILEW